MEHPATTVALLLLFALPTAGQGYDGSGEPLPGIEYSAAWNFQYSPTATWNGEAFMTAWQERERDPNSWRSFLSCSRLSEDGVPIHRYGVEIPETDSATDPLVIQVGGQTLLLWEEQLELHVARINSDCEIERAGVVADKVGSFSVAATPDRVVVAWSTSDTPRVIEAAMLDSEGSVVHGPVELGYGSGTPSLAWGDGRFLIAYDTGSASVISRTLSEDLEPGPLHAAILQTNGDPSVTHTGGQFLMVAGGRHLRVRAFGEDPESYADTTVLVDDRIQSPLIECVGGRCLVVLQRVGSSSCPIGQCPPPIDLYGLWVSLRGEPLSDEEFPLVTEGFAARSAGLTTSDERLLLTWRSDDYYGHVEGMFIDASSMSASFPLTLSANAQTLPIGSTGGAHTLLLWRESVNRNESIDGVIMNGSGLTPVQALKPESDTDYYVEGAAWTGSSWLVPVREVSQEDGPPQLRVKYVMIHPDGGISPDTVVAEYDAPVQVASGDGIATMLIGKAPSYLFVRVSATGQILHRKALTLEHTVTFARLGSGFVGVWAEWDGLYAQKLDVDGYLDGEPVLLDVNHWVIHQVESNGEEVLLLGESDSRYIAATLGSNLSLGRKRVLVYRSMSDPVSALRAVATDYGWIVSVKRRYSSLIVAIDNAERSQAFYSYPRPLDAVTIVGGDIVGVESRYVTEDPWYGTKRLFLHQLEEPVGQRKRILRRR